MKKFVLAALAVLVLNNGARAALVLRVPDIVLTQSSSVQTGSFDVYLEETLGTEATVQSYNVGLRQAPSGIVTFDEAAASSSAHPMLMPISDETFFDLTENRDGYVQGSDVYVTNDSGSPRAVDNTPGISHRDGLFSIPFMVPANTPAGTIITINVDPEATILFSGGNVVPFDIDNGSITITPIPEPAAMGLALLALPLLARRRR